jgi:hypothetical protein
VLKSRFDCEPDTPRTVNISQQRKLLLACMAVCTYEQNSFDSRLFCLPVYTGVEPLMPRDRYGGPIVNADRAVVHEHSRRPSLQAGPMYRSTGRTQYSHAPLASGQAQPLAFDDVQRLNECTFWPKCLAHKHNASLGCVSCVRALAAQQRDLLWTTERTLNHLKIRQKRISYCYYY